MKWTSLRWRCISYAPDKIVKSSRVINVVLKLDHGEFVEKKESFRHCRHTWEQDGDYRLIVCHTLTDEGSEFQCLPAPYPRGADNDSCRFDVRYHCLNSVLKKTARRYLLRI